MRQDTSRFDPFLAFPYLQPVQAAADLPLGRVAAFLLLNIALAMVSKQSSLFSTAYALVVVAIGLAWFAQDQTPDRVIYLAAYIVGAELIWRGTSARIFYEFGKYGVSFFLLLALFKYKGLERANKLPLLYFALLLPSLAVLPYFDRQAIAFHMSGPFALAVSATFFSTIMLDRRQLKRLLLAIIGPAVGLAFLALFFTLANEQPATIAGYAEKVTSAGIGPNQMSSILGLGALASFLYVLAEREQRGVRNLMVLLTIWLLGQAMLTFSRGGFWSTLLAIAAGSLFLLRDRRTRTAMLAGGIFIFLAGYFVVLPLLDSFTAGSVSARFSDPNTTNRVEIAQADLQIFQDYLPFGVGPGRSLYYHTIYFQLANAHTEYSRLLAEHGIFGLAALLILLGLSVYRGLSKASPEERGYRVMLIAWALAFMLHSAMRLVAPAFIFGLAFANLALNEDEAVNVESVQEQASWGSDELQHPPRPRAARDPW